MRLKWMTLLLLPWIIIQGKAVKKNTPRLPEPTGARQGVVGTGPKLSLLILGDSAAAGVGVEQQNQALLGAVLRQLEIDFEVHYQLEAKTGRNTTQLIQAATELPAQQVDVLIVSVGVNDVTRLGSPKRWLKQQQQFIAMLQSRFQPRMIILSGVPPMQEFPALPQPLAWLLGQYAAQMNQLMQQWLETQSDIYFLAYDLEEYRALNLSMASDGFHPSQEIYQLWGSKIAQLIDQSDLHH